MRFVDTEQVFEERARAFCSTLEADFGIGADALRKLRDVLLPLYTAALALSLPIASEDDLPEDTDRIRQERKAIEQRLANAGFQDGFWVVFDPLQLQRQDPLRTSVSDCMADIWSDLKPGLEALETDRSHYFDSAVWEWSFSFRTHWGRHAIDALRAIHFQLEDEG
ncbi:MAG TPA: DUF5063 domain-containing protein [Acidobacteriaceae bacterium]